MKLKLHVWRQKDRNSPGQMVSYDADHVSPDMSFLEMLDVVNQDLINKGDEPIHFDHDCREGICGMCSLVINGTPHGPERSTTTCQLHMRKFNDGDEIYIEPWRAKAFPVIKDLMVDRSSFDRIIQEGGYISVNTGNAPDAHAIPIGKPLPTKRSRQPHASVVVPAWHRAKMRRPCSLYLQRLLSSQCCLKAKQSGRAAFRTWSTKWMKKALAPVRTMVSARQFVQKTSK